VDLALTDEQQLLKDAARRFVEQRWAPSRVRELEAAPDGHDPGQWAQLCALGWPGLVLPESHGGAGRGMLELAIVAEELGHGAVSCALIWSTTLVALPLAWGPSQHTARAWLPGLTDGSVLGALAHLEPGAGTDEWHGPGLELRRRPGGWRVSGVKDLVAYAAIADLLLVSARVGSDGTALVAVGRRGPGVRLQRQEALGGDPLYRVGLDVEVADDDVVAEGDDGAQLLRRALDHAAVAGCAYAAGLAARALELSVVHAANREQFGRPIGAFQAVAHRCADMAADVEAVRLLALQAAWALDHLDAPELEVGAAKAYANEAVRRVFAHAHQVHGALGFSMEHDLQLFTRRAKAFELTWGSVDRHRQRVAQAIGL
jgi:alkylation response protein AidB-like acyl-CoA dehydrogenase